MANPSMVFKALSESLSPPYTVEYTPQDNIIVSNGNQGFLITCEEVYDNLYIQSFIKQYDQLRKMENAA